MAITKPDGRPPPPASDDPPSEQRPRARLTIPLVLAASGLLWGLIAHVLAHH